MTKDEFLNKATKIHELKYKYDLSEFNNASDKILITCNIHG